jgi:hypothetical protein
VRFRFDANLRKNLRFVDRLLRKRCPHHRRRATAGVTDVISVVEKYRGVEILRDEPLPSRPAGIESALAQPIVRYHAIPDGLKVSAQSLEAVRQQIDDVLDAPPDRE